MYELSKRSTDRMAGVDKRLQQIAQYAIKITRVDFGIPADGGIRSPERQKELFDKGLSKCDGVKNKSKHQSGLALDFFPYVGGKADYTEESLALVACAFLQAASHLGYKLKWGGHFDGFRDMPHVELED